MIRLHLPSSQPFDGHDENTVSYKQYLVRGQGTPPFQIRYCTNFTASLNLKVLGEKDFFAKKCANIGVVNVAKMKTSVIWMFNTQADTFERFYFN